jgi:hypothetical protein
MEVCKKNGWTMMLTKERAAQAASAASNVDPIIEDSCPTYSREGFLAALVRFIVTDDQVSTPSLVNCTWLIDFQSINVVECPEFRDLLLLLREDFKDTDIPHRGKVHDIILHTWSTYFERLKKDLEVRPFSFIHAILLIIL